MKKWIAMITATACCFSSALPADGALPNESLVDSSAATTVAEESTPTEEVPASIEPVTERKSVGKAAEDGSTTASNSRVGTYLLAGGAVAAGIIALILISRHSGHHKH